MNIAAVHQPNYLPWLGFFQKIAASDVFVFLDSVQHVRQSLTRRTKIRSGATSDEPALISIPLRAHDRFDLINHLLVDSEEWVTNHLNKIEAVYRGSPFFDQTHSWLADKLSIVRDGAPLSELNVHLIRECCEQLGLSAKFIKSSALPTTEKGSALMAEITEKVGCETYYSGGGAAGYMDENDFHSRGLSYEYQSFFDYCSEHPYKQHQGTKFLNGLSVVDALFNIGPEETRLYISRYEQWSNLRHDHEPDWQNLRFSTP